MVLSLIDSFSMTLHYSLCSTCSMDVRKKNKGNGGIQWWFMLWIYIFSIEPDQEMALFSPELYHYFGACIGMTVSLVVIFFLYFPEKASLGYFLLFTASISLIHSLLLYYVNLDASLIQSYDLYPVLTSISNATVILI